MASHAMGALYGAKCPTSVCQVSVLLGFVIGKSKNRHRRQCSQPPFHCSPGSPSYFRNAIVMLLSAKARHTLGQPPISHLQGCFLFSQPLCSQGFTIAPSLPPICFPAAADSLTDSRSAGVPASVSWRQWQRMRVITIPSQGLPLCLESLCG